MGTKFDSKSYFLGQNDCYYNSMRDLNEDSSSSSWPTCYGENNIASYGTDYNGLMPTAVADGHLGYGKEAMKQKILEHEAIFKNQVYELHRLYRIQRDMMEEFKRKELVRLRASVEPSSSSNLRSQIQTQDPRKWHMAGFTLTNSGYENQTSITGAEIKNSPLNCTKGHSIAQPSKESEPSDSRPMKVRKRLFDLQLPADEYMDTEESGKKLSASIGLADLNELVEMEEAMAPSTVDFLDHNPINGVEKVDNHYLPSVKSSLNERGWLSHLYEAGSSRSNLGSVSHSLLHKEKMAILSQPAPGPFNRGPGPGSLFDSSGFASQPLSITSWANPTSSHTQKPESCLDTPKNSLTLAQLREKYLVNGNLSLNPISGGGISAQVSASKSNQESNPFSANNVLWNNSKPAIDINLNEVEELPATLPWLIRGPNSGNRPTITDLNQQSSDCQTQNVEKIPIFRTQEMAQPSEKRNGTVKIDINLECQPSEEEIEIPPDEVITEKEVKNQTKAPFLDLNSSVCDYEEENDSSVKIVDMDLESPVENEDAQLLQTKENETKENETVDAAETMVAISNATLAESLIGFVDSISDELEKLTTDDRSPIELDDFEAMTLEIQETKEEDYMPTPFVFEETGVPTSNVLVTRPRRGQTRRGRQRRDFQRDILPGLVSLSRHEVTEDIQTFGGLMRATGHRWARRNGGGRGRRRAVEEGVSGSDDRSCQAPVAVAVAEGGGVEDKSLTGWGKRTSRPRRQRCSAGNGNTPAVVGV